MILVPKSEFLGSANSQKSDLRPVFWFQDFIFWAETLSRQGVGAGDQNWQLVSRIAWHVLELWTGNNIGIENVLVVIIR